MRLCGLVLPSYLTSSQLFPSGLLSQTASCVPKLGTLAVVCWRQAKSCTFQKHINVGGFFWHCRKCWYIIQVNVCLHVEPCNIRTLRILISRPSLPTTAESAVGPFFVCHPPNFMLPYILCCCGHLVVVHMFMFSHSFCFSLYKRVCEGVKWCSLGDSELDLGCLLLFGNDCYIQMLLNAVFYFICITWLLCISFDSNAERWEVPCGNMCCSFNLISVWAWGLCSYNTQVYVFHVFTAEKTQNWPRCCWWGCCLLAAIVKHGASLLEGQCVPKTLGDV